MNNKRGVIVAFCGADASGKTTVVNYLLDKLCKTTENNEWHYYKYPNRSTPIGQKIDKILKGELVVDKQTELKFFADNRKEDIKQILKIVYNGGNILLDRYVYCSLAYTFTNQVKDVLSFKQINLMTFNEIIKYDKGCIKPDFVYLIKANHLHTRTNSEIYDMDNSDRELLYNNYIVALLNTTSRFCILDNSGDIEQTIYKIFIHLNKFVINSSDIASSTVERF